jgi:cytochrome b561
MQWRNDRMGYGLVHITLHWLVALLILGMLPLGLWMTGLDYYDPWYRRAPDIHRAIGVLLATLLLIRLLWRLGSILPRPLATRPWQIRLAGSVHALLYLLPFALIVSGYLMSTADGRPVDVFGWFEIPATLHGIDGQEDIAGDIHFALAMILIAVVVLHIAAAIHHHRVIRDDTLRRMLRPNSGNTALSGDER